MQSLSTDTQASGFVELGEMSRVPVGIQQTVLGIQPKIEIWPATPDITVHTTRPRNPPDGEMTFLPLPLHLQAWWRKHSVTWYFSITDCCKLFIGDGYCLFPPLEEAYVKRACTFSNCWICSPIFC